MGIIPARAGSRVTLAYLIHGMRDHPRACGEQIALYEDNPMYTGSSPRVRGAARLVLHRGTPSGIIPARAGSSPAARLKVP